MPTAERRASFRVTMPTTQDLARGAAGPADPPDDFFGPRTGGSADRRPLAIGHRGAAGAAPENTLPALEHARDVGADAVEFDLQVTRDGRLVLLHDPTVDRTTDGSGEIGALPLAEVRRLDAGHAFTPDRGRSFPFRGRGVRVPTLEEALEVLDGLPAVAEVKSAEAGARLAAFLRERPEAARRLIVGGFERAAAGPAAREARWRGAWQEELTPYVLLGKVGLAGLAVPDADAAMVPERKGLVRIPTPRFVRRAHRDGIGVHVWTVNRPDRMRALLDAGVDGILSDFPARALRIALERTAADDEGEAAEGEGKAASPGR